MAEAQEHRGIFGRAYPVARIAGIAIRVDLSWLAIAALVVWSFWIRFDNEPGVGPVTALALAVVGAALFFGSVLAHELAHALEAQHRGVTVAGITLFLFGGVTESKFDVKRPRDEFALTAVGPFTSIVLGAVFGLVATWTGNAGMTEIALVTGWLGWINVALGVFNLLPGAPLDGGRILRSIVWSITGDRLRSIRFAAGAGFVVGSLIIAAGFVQMFVPGAFIGGLWFLFIGWFLIQAAGSEWAHAQLRQALTGLDVASLVDPDLPRIPADVSVQRAEEGWIRVREADVFPVVDGSDRVVGVVGVDEVCEVPVADRPYISVSRVMVALDDLPRLAAHQPAEDAVDELLEAGRLVVNDSHGSARGIVTARRLDFVARRALALQERRRRRSSSPADEFDGKSVVEGPGESRL